MNNGDNPPQIYATNTSSRKRKFDLRNSSYFKICTIVRQLRPKFIQVLRTPNFRDCQAAHEIQKRMMRVMDLYKHMQIGRKRPKIEMSTKNKPNLKRLEGSRKDKLHQEHHQNILTDGKSEGKKASSVQIPLGKKEEDDVLQLRGSYVVGGSVSGIFEGAHGIGVNYGLLGDNLPSPDQVIMLLKSRGINKIRIFDPNPDVLNALHGSGIEVVLGVRNEDLQQLANDAAFAQTWVSNNVVPHASFVTFTYITAGNEVVPGPQETYVLGAMQNLDSSLKSANLPIPVTTAVSLQVLGSSYPPSHAALSENVVGPITGIVQFLADKQSPLLVNVYPYFAYNGDPANVKLDYALFQDTALEQPDGESTYKNIFDAMVDAVYHALEQVEGGGGVDIVVAETGWPSSGNGNGATVENAQAYVNKLINHVACNKGTPKRPGKHLETYIFALFNEDLKPAGTEQNYGLFYPDMTEVYHVNFLA